MAGRPSVTDVDPEATAGVACPAFLRRPPMPASRGPRSRASATPAIPGYAIGKMLGRGGMGVVYKATQVALKRPVALKMIRGDSHIEPAQLERFRVEAEAVARLQHPNVVQIYEVGEFAGMPYFSLELVEGGTLAERLAGAPMAPRPAAELAVTLARAMGAVHRVGIVHRDLKPANVLLHADGTPKVTDFGLAKRLEVEEGQTMTGQVMGTPSYMAPEQAQGQTDRIGPPADIYALGAILYETLTGRPPFKGPSTIETLSQVAFQEPVPPSRLQPRVPRDLETICLKCLAKEPARRYDTADELADDLERFLAGTPIRARRTPAWERAAKWARRRPAAAALVAVGLFLAIGLAVAGERYAGLHAATRNRALARLRLEAITTSTRALQERAERRRSPGRMRRSRSSRRSSAPSPAWPTSTAASAPRSRAVDAQLAAAEQHAADRDRLSRFGTLFDRGVTPRQSCADLPRDVRSGSRSWRGRPMPRAPSAPAAQIRTAAAAALEVFPLGSGAAPDPCPRHSHPRSGPRSRRTVT